MESDNEVEGFSAERWSPQEIEHAVKAYLEMLEEEIAGRQINKAAVNAASRWRFAEPQRGLD